MSEKPSPLISADHLEQLLGDSDLGVVDCRFALDDPSRGKLDWSQACIPGARYAHLDDDLSAPLGDGHRGRHPLPSPEHIRRLLASWGFTEDTFIVCYDDAGGPFAARLWWMLTWIGHDDVAVLDGGWQAWKAAGGPVAAGTSVTVDGDTDITYQTTSQKHLLADAQQLLEKQITPVDARARERFLGLNEPIDPVAGHIPGAANMPWMENLGPDGRFLPAEELAKRWAQAGGTEGAVCYCGSGVTACHNILAAAIAGLPVPRLYAPSWSGWIHDPERPIATGEES